MVAVLDANRVQEELGKRGIHIDDVIEIVADNENGIDYLYTVQGQLKSINSPNLGATAANIFKDPGQDGSNGFATDVFGMSIDYYAGDYKRKDTYVNNTGGLQSSYSGNIAAVRWNTQGQSLANTSQQNMYAYGYDHHNWLAAANFGNYTPIAYQNNDGSPTEKLGLEAELAHYGINPNADYRVSNLTYDANGNLLSLDRNGYTATDQTNTMDELVYSYALDADGNRIDNKLRSVIDTEHGNDYEDIQDQSDDNYVYNTIGQLEHNVQEGHYYSYDAYGLVTGVYTDAYYTMPVAKYYYDDKGFRVKKELFESSSIPVMTTYYVRDMSGNVLSTYDEEQEQSLVQKEVPIYGASRLGHYKPENDEKMYELTDHLGTVRALISRDKNTDGTAEILMRADYYPFGMEMPGRKYSSEAYRYGYQGQFAEKEGETGLHSFELRQWDARIARWNSTDPYGQYFSPYMGMGNNPLSLVDPNGGFAGGGDPPISHTMMNEITLTASGGGTPFSGLSSISLSSLTFDFEVPDIIRDWDGIYRRGQGEYFDNGIGFRYNLQDGVGIRSSAQVNGRFSISDDGEVSVYAQVFHAEKNINYEYKGVVRFRVNGKETMVRLNVNPELDNIYSSIYKPIGYARYNIPRTGVVDMEIYIGYEVNTGAGYFNGEYFNQSYKLSW